MAGKYFKRRSSVNGMPLDRGLGSVWNGDWHGGRVLKGSFGNDAKPRHHAVCLGGEPPASRYAGELGFLPMTSSPHEEGTYLMKLPVGSLLFVKKTSYVLPIKLVARRADFGDQKIYSCMGKLPDIQAAQLQRAWTAHVKAYRM